MMSVAETQIRQIQPLVRGNRMSKALLQKRRQSLIIIAMAPGSIDPCNSHGRIADALDPKRNALSNIDHAPFDVRTIKKRYARILTCHLIYSLLFTRNPMELGKFRS